LADYCQGLVTSYRNEYSFTRGAFTLKKYFSPFLPFGPLFQPLWCLSPSEEDNDVDDDEEDGGARGSLNIGGSGGGREGSCSEGGIAGFPDPGISEAHLASLAAAVPEAFPFSGLVACCSTSFLTYSVFASNLFSMLASASFHCSYNYFLKESLSFWYFLSLYACSMKGLLLGCSV
jgi:hypothetical protein